MPGAGVKKQVKPAQTSSPSLIAIRVHTKISPAERHATNQHSTAAWASPIGAGRDHSGGGGPRPRQERKALSHDGRQDGTPSTIGFPIASPQHISSLSQCSNREYIIPRRLFDRVGGRVKNIQPLSGCGSPVEII